MKNNNFATKQDLKRIEDKLLEEIKNVRGEVQDFKNETFNRLNRVMGELQTMREEQIIHLGRHEEIEERVAKLEQSTNT